MKYIMTVKQMAEKEIPIFAESEQEAIEQAESIFLHDDMEFMADNDVEFDTSFSLDKSK